MDRLLGSPEDLFVPVLCMEVNATCVSPAWISALVDGTGRSTRRWKSLVGTLPRRFCGPSGACYVWFAKGPATRNPRTLDPSLTLTRTQVVSRSSVGRWKWQRGEQLFDLPDVVCKPRRHRW